MVLVCIFMIITLISDSEHLFMCLLAFCMLLKAFEQRTDMRETVLGHFICPWHKLWSDGGREGELPHISRMFTHL